MTRDEIIKLAREAGSIDSEEVIETMYCAFAASEREACAKVCVASELIDMATTVEIAAVRKCAAAIRARGEKGSA